MEIFYVFQKNIKYKKMKRIPFITILTASFNNASTIKKTLESIRSQTFSDLEHIVIDGGSSDGTISILKNYEGMYNLKWLSEKDEGIADALNKGIKKANGKYILVIHADDHLINLDVLQDAYICLKSEEYDIVSHPIILNHVTKGEILCSNKPIWKMRFKTVLRHQGVFIHRRLHEKIGGYNSTFFIALDYDFFYRALMKGAKIKIKNQPITQMEGTGIGSDVKFLQIRIKEDYQVQKLNETNLVYKFLQFFYFIYKKKFRHLVRKSFRIQYSDKLRLKNEKV